MRAARSDRQIRHPSPQPSAKDLPIVVVARQSGEAIRQRREIRETFHDSRAVTIKRKRG